MLAALDLDAEAAAPTCVPADAPGDRFCRTGHAHLLYDDIKQTVECRDCHSTLSPWLAFKALVQHFDARQRSLKAQAAEIRAAQEANLISRAAKRYDEMVRRKGMAPCFPHCQEALLPEDVLNMSGSANIVHARKRRLANDADAGAQGDAP
jgi:hypothetical protein